MNNYIEDIAYLDYWFQEHKLSFIIPYIEKHFHDSSWQYQLYLMEKYKYFCKTVIENDRMENDRKINELINKVRFGKSKIIIVVGARGSGKTASALYLAEEAHQSGDHNIIYYVGIPEYKDIYPEYYKFVRTLDELPIGCFAIIDESAIKYSSRRFQSKQNQDLSDKMVILRHKDTTLVLITQNISMIEINADRLADIIIYKVGSDYGIRKKRGETSSEDFSKENMLILNRLKPRKKEDCMVEYRAGFKKIFRTLQTPLPLFWDETKISKSFRNFQNQPVEIKLINKEKTKKKGVLYI